MQKPISNQSRPRKHNKKLFDLFDTHKCVLVKTNRYRLTLVILVLGLGIYVEKFISSIT